MQMRILFVTIWLIFNFYFMPILRFKVPKGKQEWLRRKLMIQEWVQELLKQMCLPNKEKREQLKLKRKNGRKSTKNNTK